MIDENCIRTAVDGMYIRNIQLMICRSLQIFEDSIVIKFRAFLKVFKNKGFLADYLR